MKRLLPIVLILIGMPSTAQDKDREMSQADEFSLQTGKLLEREFIDVGKFKNIEVRVLNLKDLSTGQGTSALRIETTISRGTYSSSRKLSSLDIDEVEDLLKAIANLQENVFNSTRENYTEVIFRSRGGFEAGAFFDTSKKKWTAYIQIDRYDKDSTIFLSQEDFSAIHNLVRLAKEKVKR
jgi:hypothetical protein